MTLKETLKEINYFLNWDCPAAGIIVYSVAGALAWSAISTHNWSRNAELPSPKANVRAKAYASLPIWERRYDLNRNGILEENELKLMAKDGRISLQELVSRRQRYFVQSSK